MPETAARPPEPPSEPTPAAPSALDLVREELLAMEARSLLSVNVDVGAAALLVLGAANEIRTLEPDLRALCGEEATRCVGRLDVLARAALQAHAAYLAFETGIDVLPLVGELTSARHVLGAEVRNLIARGVLPAGVVGEISKGQGYKNLCVDVLQLVAIFQTSWEYLRGKTGIPWSDVERAEGLANELATLVGMRDRPSESPAADLRRRAFSLLAHTYDDARRVVTYLRWKQGDYDRIAPSFYAARAVGRRRKSGSEPSIPPPAPEEAVPIGLPGSSPFASG